MVDAARVTALLQRIRDELAALGVFAARSDADLLDDDDALPAAKYRLIVMIEAAIDIADHVIASEGLRPSSSLADSFLSLQEAGWLDKDLATWLQDAARFRNLLVHQYADVDDDRVIEILRTRRGDLEGYVVEIARRIEAMD